MKKLQHALDRTTRQNELDQDNPFVRVPDVFFGQLSQEERRERQQIYAEAYEKAVRQVARPKTFVPPFEFEMEDGSGI
jgi:hypothetical protein